MTFTQNLLGKNYKWWYLVKYEWSRAGATSFGDFVFQFQIFLTNTLWIYIYSLNSIQTVVYLTTGRVISFLTNNFWYNKIGLDITSGKITNLLLFPQSIFKLYFFQSLGGRLFRNILSTITIFIVVFLFNVFLINTPSSDWLGITIVFLPLIFFINFLNAIILGSVAFYIKDKRDFHSLAEASQSILNILSGLMIPLNTIPVFGRYLVYLPFSINFYHPTQIYLGKYDNVQIIWILLGGIAWCVILYILAKIVFKLGLKQNESVGL